MKIQAGTTYKRGDGREVYIAGLAKTPPIEGQTVFWSRCGDWYAEDGRWVGYTANNETRLFPAGNWRSLQE